MKGIVEKLSKGEELSEVDHVIIKAFARFNERQASLFGQFSIRGKLKYKEHVENYLNDLPDQFSYEELEKIARKDAEASSPLSTMICSWSLINLPNQRSMCSLLFSLSIKNGWPIQSSARKCINMLWKKFVTS